MADERQLALPDRILVGGASRYDFLSWMAGLKIQPEWRWKNIWLQYGDRNAVTPDGENWRVSSYRMLPGMTVLIPPEGVSPTAVAKRPDTQIVLFEEFPFGKSLTREQVKSLSETYAVRIVLVDQPIRSGSTDLDADDAVGNDAQNQCEAYHQAGWDAVCIQPPKEDEPMSVAAVLGGSDTLRQKWRRKLQAKLERGTVLLDCMEFNEIFALDDNAVWKEVMSFESFQKSGQTSFWKAYALRAEKFLFQNKSDFLSWAKAYYEESDLNTILMPSVWDAERDWKTLKDKLLEAYRSEMTCPKQETEIAGTESEYRDRSNSTVSAFKKTLDHYIEKIAPELIQAYARERYEQIEGALNYEINY